jgi:hypothetical protein
MAYIGWESWRPFKTVQDRNVMITRRAQIDRNKPEPLGIEFGHGLDAVEEESGWIFVRAGKAFGAVKVVGKDGYKWIRAWKKEGAVNLVDGKPETGRRDVVLKFGGVVSTMKDSAFFITLANDAADYNNDFDTFKKAVAGQRVYVRGSAVEFSAVGFANIAHNGIKGPGYVNRKPEDLRPGMLFDSPFLRSVRGSGVIYIRKGDETMILDFRNSREPKRILGEKPDKRFPPGIGTEKPIVFSLPEKSQKR